MSFQPNATVQISEARMNIIPPIVGVPALLLCHFGPISRMDCPALRARSIGMAILPKSTVRTNAQTAASKISMRLLLRIP